MKSEKKWRSALWLILLVAGLATACGAGKGCDCPSFSKQQTEALNNASKA